MELSKQWVHFEEKYLRRIKLRVQSYFKNRRDVADFLENINTWWTISNSKKRFSPSILGNAVINGEKKTEFLRALADWI